MKTVNSYAELAEIAGVSKATISMAMRNHPKISQATRTRIQEIAERYGYKANPLVTAHMTMLKNGKKEHASVANIAFIGLKPIAELIENPESALGACYFGAKAKAENLGFTLDYIQFNPKKMKASRLQGIIKSRGIRAVIFTPFSDTSVYENFDLEWDEFAYASINNAFQHPKMHSICNDHFETILRLMEQLKDKGRKRIGMSVHNQTNPVTKTNWMAGYQIACKTDPKIEYLAEFSCKSWNSAELLNWINENNLDTLITNDEMILDFLQENKSQLPSHFKIVCPDKDCYHQEISGFSQNHAAIGSVAIDLLSAQLFNNQYGVPKETRKVLLQPVGKDL